MGSELRRKTIGLIGLGGIGGALTELLKPFQTTELLAFDPYVAPERAAALNTRLTGSQRIAASFGLRHRHLSTERADTRFAGS